LVAVGVLDLLPECVSAVYFLYDESIHDWSPGKLGALREIALAIEGGYRWWYPGFYIHTCPKMRYKMDYSPQQILNPDSMEWVEVSEEVLARFDSHGYLHFEKTGNNQAAVSKKGQVDGSEDVAYILDDGGSSDDDEDDISLLQSNMPGLPSMDDIASYDYDNIPVRLKKGIFPAIDVLQWRDEDEDEDEYITKYTGPKAQLAQMAAAVGFDIMPQLCLDLVKLA
jgi:arginine-tRNA-protein transferase